MDGENNGKPYSLMDDVGGKIPLFLDLHPYFGGREFQVMAIPKPSLPRRCRGRRYGLNMAEGPTGRLAEDLGQMIYGSS